MFYAQPPPKSQQEVLVPEFVLQSSIILKQKPERLSMFDIQIAEHYWNNLLKICTYWHRLLIDLRKLNKLLSYNKDISFIDEKSLKYFW